MARGVVKKEEGKSRERREEREELLLISVTRYFGRLKNSKAVRAAP